MSNAQIYADKLHRNEIWLRKTYVDEGKTMQEIADSQGVTAAAVCGMLKKFEIPTRRRGRHIINCTCGSCPSTKPGAAIKPKPSRSFKSDTVEEDPTTYVPSFSQLGVGSSPQDFATEISMGELQNLKLRLQEDLMAVDRAIALLG